LAGTPNDTHTILERARLWEMAEILPQVDKFENLAADFFCSCSGEFSSRLCIVIV
jgi:hypothetical protein